MSLKLYDEILKSRLMLGTAQYPSPDILIDAIKQSSCEIITVSLRRENYNIKTGHRFWSILKKLNLKILPNTAGCHSVKEAVTTAHMAREIFNTKWIKLEVIGNSDSLQPDVLALVEAARILNEDGFQVFPYTTEDLTIAEKLLSVGCEVLMPWGSPIGTGRGLNNIYGLKSFRAYFPNISLIIDSGIGLPSHAANAMEMGFDCILLNTSVAKAGDPTKMAKAFSMAIRSGRIAFNAIPIEKRNMAIPSTPILGQAFLL